MNKIDKIKIDKVIHKIGLKYNLLDSVVKDIVDSPYLFTHEKYKEIDFGQIKTEEELGNLKTNFIYRAFGRLYVGFPVVNRRNKHKENSINLNKNRVNGRSKQFDTE